MIYGSILFFEEKQCECVIWKNNFSGKRQEHYHFIRGENEYLWMARFEGDGARGNHLRLIDVNAPTNKKNYISKCQ